MKQVFAILLFALMSVMSSAQEVKWGPELKRKPNEFINKFIAQDASGFYVLRTENEGANRSIPIIEHYSSRMKLKYSKKLEGIDRRDVFFNDFFHFNDRLFVIFTQYKAKDKQHILFYQEVSKKSGRLVGKGLSLATSNSKARHLQGHFDYEISPDSSKAVILYSEAPRRGFGGFTSFSTASNKFTVKVLDENFEKVWYKKIDLPYDEELYEHKKIQVDEEGNVYILAKIYDKVVRDKKRGKANYKYKIIALRDKGEDKIEYDLFLKDKFISDITFKLNNKTNDIICSGFYSERNSVGIKGAFFFTVDKETKDISRDGIKAFSTDFMSNFMRERRAKRGGELNGFDMRDIVLRSDGGAVLLAEQFFVRRYEYTNPNGSIDYRYTYYHNEIIAVNINPDGSIAWNAYIPKFQQSSSPAFSSFSKAVVKDKIYFIFNERIAKRSPVILATVDAKGKVNMKDLFRNKDVDVVTRPVVCKQISKNEMIVYGELRRKYKFGKIIF